MKVYNFLNMQAKATKLCDFSKLYLEKNSLRSSWSSFDVALITEMTLRKNVLQMNANRKMNENEIEINILHINSAQCQLTVSEHPAHEIRILVL